MWSLSLYSWKAARANRFPKILFIKEQTQWLNDKTIIGLGHRKVSWFVSGEQINYLRSRMLNLVQ